MNLPSEALLTDEQITKVLLSTHTGEHFSWNEKAYRNISLAQAQHTADYYERDIEGRLYDAFEEGMKLASPAIQALVAALEWYQADDEESACMGILEHASKRPATAALAAYKEAVNK